MRAFLFVVWTLLKNGFRAARDMFRGDAEDRHELEDAHDSDAYDSIDGLPDDEPGVPGEALRSVNVVIDGGDHDIEFSAPPGVDTTRWPGSSTSHGAFLGPEERDIASERQAHHATARRADDKQAHVNTCNAELRRVSQVLNDKQTELNKEIQRLLKIQGLARRALQPHVVGADRYVLHTVARIAAEKLTAQARRIEAFEAQLSRASGRKAPPANARATTRKSAKRAR